MALEKKLSDFRSALERLNESYMRAQERVKTDEFEFYRDSTIQRFEFTLEIAWKSIKTYLFEKEGIECRSPKGCIREFFSAGLFDQSNIETLLEMIDDRNLATHTYHEALAEEIFTSIGTYVQVLQKLYTQLTNNP